MYSYFPSLNPPPPNVSNLSFMQVQYYLRLRQLHSDVQDFNNGVSNE